VCLHVGGIGPDWTAFNGLTVLATRTDSVGPNTSCRRRVNGLLWCGPEQTLGADNELVEKPQESVTRTQAGWLINLFVMFFFCLAPSMTTTSRRPCPCLLHCHWLQLVCSFRCVCPGFGQINLVRQSQELKLTTGLDGQSQELKLRHSPDSTFLSSIGIEWQNSIGMR